MAGVVKTPWPDDKKEKKKWPRGWRSLLWVCCITCMGLQGILSRGRWKLRGKGKKACQQ